MIPMNQQDYQKYYQMFKGNYYKGVSILRSMLDSPLIAEKLLSTPAALAAICTDHQRSSVDSFCYDEIQKEKYAQYSYAAALSYSNAILGTAYDDFYTLLYHTAHLDTILQNETCAALFMHMYNSYPLQKLLDDVVCGYLAVPQGSIHSIKEAEKAGVNLTWLATRKPNDELIFGLLRRAFGVQESPFLSLYHMGRYPGANNWRANYSDAWTSGVYGSYMRQWHSASGSGGDANCSCDFSPDIRLSGAYTGLYIFQYERTENYNCPTYIYGSPGSIVNFDDWFHTKDDELASDPWPADYARRDGCEFRFMSSKGLAAKTVISSAAWAYAAEDAYVYSIGLYRRTPWEQISRAAGKKITSVADIEKAGVLQELVNSTWGVYCPDVLMSVVRFSAVLDLKNKKSEPFMQCLKNSSELRFLYDCIMGRDITYPAVFS